MTAWQYHPAPDLASTPMQRLARFPREPDILCYAFRAAAAIFMRVALRVYNRFQITGREHLPTDGRSYIIVANHASHLDAPCLLSAIRLRRIHRAYPAAAKDYFFHSATSTALAATFVNALPFDRKTGVRQSMEVCRELLRRPGNVLIVFPEGTRSTGGDVGPFRRGVGDLVASTDIPVVPCYLDGAAVAWPKGAILPHPRRVRLFIGPPRTYQSAKPDKASSLAIGDELRDAVLSLAPHDARTTTDAKEGGHHNTPRSTPSCAAAAGTRSDA